MRDAFYERRSRWLAILLLIHAGAFLLFLFLSQWQAVANLSYRLHELCCLPVALLPFSVGFCLAAAVYTWYRLWRKRHRDIRLFFWNLAAICAVGLVAAVYIVMMNTVTTSGYAEFRKYEQSGRYYIQIGNRSFPVPENEYRMITDGGYYRFTYTHNALFPQADQLKEWKLG